MINKKLDKILKEELELETTNKVNDIVDFINKFSTPNITVYNNNFDEQEYLYFAFLESIYLDAYKDEINDFLKILTELFNKLDNNRNILIKKKFDNRIIYLGKGFNEESELIDFCKEHKLADYIDIESGKIEDIKKLDSSYNLEFTKDEVTFPPELLSKLEIHHNKVKLYHYGTETLIGGELSTKFYKKNPVTTDTYGQPRIFFYIKREEREKVIYGHEYIVEVPLDDLYPFNSDPFYLYNKAVEEYGNENIPVSYQILYITEEILKLDFKGMIFKWNNTYRVDYFYPIKPININY